MMKEKKRNKNFRKRSIGDVLDNDNQPNQKHDSDDDDHQTQMRMALEEVKFLQKQRQRKSGICVVPHSNSSNSNNNVIDSVPNNNTEDKEKDQDDLALIKDTFAQETAVMLEDPNMVKYIEQQLAKKRGNSIPDSESENQISITNAVDNELYNIPDHLKVKPRNSLETSTQWTTGIAEIQLPIEYKLRNIEETEAAKKLLQEKRLVGNTKSQINIPSSFSADYFQRGKDYAERLRRDHPELYKDRAAEDGAGSKETDTGTDAAGQRLAATDQIMLERFRKRERQRGMRR